MIEEVRNLKHALESDKAALSVREDRLENKKVELENLRALRVSA